MALYAVHCPWSCGDICNIVNNHAKIIITILIFKYGTELERDIVLNRSFRVRLLMSCPVSESTSLADLCSSQLSYGGVTLRSQEGKREWVGGLSMSGRLERKIQIQQGNLRGLLGFLRCSWDSQIWRGAVGQILLLDLGLRISSGTCNLNDIK